jgi:murein DD-endopeptidase MepM/ murein hydrolase activator NlpD
MSYTSLSYFPNAAAARPKSAAAVSRHLHRPRQSGYTLTHGGRQVRIGPVAFWIVVGTLVVMAIWSIATGTYFAFREDVLTRLVSRQAQMQFAYEDRIAELRGQIDRITSRQLLDQEQFEQKLSGLLQRQSVLERRSTVLSEDVTATGTISPGRGASSKKTSKAAPSKPSPIDESEADPVAPDRQTNNNTGGALNGMLTRVSTSLDKIDHRQIATLANLEKRVDGKASRMRHVFAEIGVDPTKLSTGGKGGPFLPIIAPVSGSSDFDRMLYRVNVARARVDVYAHALGALPVRKPVPGELDVSSPFGVRMDPFLGRPAMHTGVDLRGDLGERVHATAGGMVQIAGRDGGYGKMVEIDHGNGFSTRYGHLSEIDVRVGQEVHLGDTIGRIGSTGRSTGPHLHYETRINGEAVDPQKFLRAGIQLGSL